MDSRFTGRRRCHGNRSDGYVLLTLILFVALLAIAMTALAPAVVQQIKRDREEELIHRGVQYSRAIKHYFKKFRRYPTKIEDLEDTNNVRFLRKAYKDPVTGKDFKILRMGDVQMSFGPGLTGATSAANLASQSGTFGSGNGPFAGSAFGAIGGNTFGANNFGGGAFGSNAASASAAAANANSPPASGQDASGANPDQSLTPGAPGAPGTSTPPGQATTNADNKVFGGGPIVGVASISKEKSIRIFNKKDHYYQWQFIYDPSTDRGGLLTTPNQPGLQSAAGGVQPVTPGNPGAQPNSPFGPQGSQFGFPGGSQMTPGGMQAPQPAPSQQQPLQPQFPPDQAPQ